MVFYKSFEEWFNEWDVTKDPEVRRLCKIAWQVALIAAAEIVPGVQVIHGDQYGTWVGTIESDHAKKISEAILGLK